MTAAPDQRLEQLAERLWDAGLQPDTASTAAALLTEDANAAGWAACTLAPGVVIWAYIGGHGQSEVA